MVDSYLVRFDRGLAQALDDASLGFYKPSGTYTAAESTVELPVILIGGEMPTTLDNCLVLNQQEPISEGRGDLIHRVQIISRLKGTAIDSRNLAWALFEALDHKERIPDGFDVSWVWRFSELHLSRDSNDRYTVYQNFFFRGRRPL